MLLDESDSKTVRMPATTVDHTARAEALADEVHFPDVEGAIPQPERDQTIYDPARHGAVEFDHVRITVEARKITEMLAAMVGLAGEGRDCPVVLTVPLAPDKLIRLDASSFDRSAVGAIAPIAPVPVAESPAQPAGVDSPDAAPVNTAEAAAA